MLRCEEASSSPSSSGAGGQLEQYWTYKSGGRGQEAEMITSWESPRLGSRERQRVRMEIERECALACKCFVERFALERPDR